MNAPMVVGSHHANDESVGCTLDGIWKNGEQSWIEQHRSKKTHLISMGSPKELDYLEKAPFCTCSCQDRSMHKLYGLNVKENTKISQHNRRTAGFEGRKTLTRNLEIRRSQTKNEKTDPIKNTLSKEKCAVIIEHAIKPPTPGNIAFTTSPVTIKCPLCRWPHTSHDCPDLAAFGRPMSKQTITYRNEGESMRSTTSDEPLKK
jgi:hypothetical protein